MLSGPLGLHTLVHPFVRRSSVVDSQELYSSKTSALEGFVLRRICDPILDRLPRTLNPNWLTLVNHVLCWACLFFAAAAPSMAPVDALIARSAAALLVFMCMLLDCLDGMHARRTGQTSRVGEVLDHWLDGLNTPLNAAAMALTLQLDPWTSAVVMVSMGMVYIVQLSVWHTTGKFLCPPTSGVDAQCLLSLSFLGAGVYFFVWPLDANRTAGEWVGLVFGWTCVATALEQVFWFACRSSKATLRGLVVNIVIFANAALYPLGLLSGIEAFVFIAIASFRVAGSYVLYTVLGRKYTGIDVPLILLLPLVSVTYHLAEPVTLGPYGLGDGLALAAATLIGGLTIGELIAHFSELRHLDRPDVAENHP